MEVNNINVKISFAENEIKINHANSKRVTRMQDLRLEGTIYHVEKNLRGRSMPYAEP
jgi:hypothetical protein